MSSTHRRTKVQTEPTIDLSDGQAGPVIDLRSVDADAVPSPRLRIDTAYLAEVLIDQNLRVADVIDLTVDDLTVIHTDTGSYTDADRYTDTDSYTDPGADTGDDENKNSESPARSNSWKSWAPRDGSAVGQVITPRTVATARRLFKLTKAGRPLVASPGTFYPSHRRFSADFVHRNLSTNLPEAQQAAQYRLEYFVGLSDDEFEHCFRYNGEITREYVLHANRSDRLYRERKQPTPKISATERRIRKAEAVRDL